MNRKIIFNGREGRFDVPLFTLSDNEDLTIELMVPAPRCGVYYVTARHGHAVDRVEVFHRRPVITLSAEWLNLNFEDVIIGLELRDKSGAVVYKAYEIEPLSVEQCDIDVGYYGAVQRLDAENEVLQRSVSVLESRLAQLETTVEGIPALIEQAKNDAVIEAAGGDPMGV